ncbi:MFS transporter [Pseudomonas entomophila]|uniref:MDR family MFS transporter n=1 Tax=Pseudomonas entomophila TaxID=312306 RepID=UPI0023D83FDE|nr:MFS transporter [Pseudomonas entomophila]MDF0729459.1 MFS transporter [Pseudomonas entomophila]
MAPYSPVIRRLMLCSLTLVISRSLTSPLLALFLTTQLGLAQHDVGLLIGIAALSGTLLGLYGGYVVDRFDKRRLLGLAMGSTAVGFLLLTFAQNAVQAALILVLTESASALFVIGSKAMLGDYLAVEHRARAFSLRYTLTNIGYATGPMLGVVLVGVHPLAPFWTSSAVALLSLSLMIAVPPGTRASPSGQAPTRFLAVLAAVRNDRVLLLFTAGSLLNAVVHGRFTIYLSQYLLVKYPPEQAMTTLSALLACNALTVIVLQFQFGRLLQRDNLARWMAVGAVLFIGGLLGFIYADNLTSWCLAMFVFTLGEMILLPAEFLFIDTLAPERLKGSYYGFQNLAALGGALSPVLCGYLLGHGAPGSMFVALMATALCGGGLCAAACAWARQRRAQEDTR